MVKKLFIIAAIALGFAAKANAQTNVQLFYDLGKDRQYATTTFEMFKGDKWGDTFFFIDHYYSTKDQREAGLSSAVNSTYFEIERGINFWQDTKLKDLSAHVEYDGSGWGAGVWCFGAKYFLHSADFRNTFTLALMYDLHCGVGSAYVPVKLSGVWGMNDLFGLKGLTFKGFIDVWGNDAVWGIDDTTKLSVLTEPQVWYNVGNLFGCENLSIGGEVELSFNFAGNKGFMCNPCIGTKWVF